ncbi:condensation domain-containing protein, partial [Sphingobacterium lactis]|uniref:condensation domain-containing protein n=1 Tax=Sphingobacterium lactis TaxID=797291 RepID=UPI003EC85047
MRKLQILLNELRKLRVQIRLVDDQLKINAPNGVLTPTHLKNIKENKAEIIAYLSSASKEIYRPIRRVSEMENYALSNSQKRLWVLSQFDGQSVAYNISSLYRMKGLLNTNALTIAINHLVERHESLRTVFVLDDGEPRQSIKSIEEAGIELVIHDLRSVPEAEYHALNNAKEISMEQFDLENGPLFRVEIFQVSDSVSILLCAIHHIISDEWSMQVMVREIKRFYNAVVDGKDIDLRELPIQYKDYAAWQQEEIADDKMKEHKDYWLSHFRGELPVLNLTTDYSRPVISTHKGAYLRRKCAPAQFHKFQQLLQQMQATVFMGVISLVNILLYRYSGQSDLIIGTPIAGREHPDLDEQIGFYVNTLAFRNKINTNDSFLDVLEHAKQIIIQGFNHQSYPFDLLVDELGIKRDPVRSPLFDVMVVLHGAGENSTENLAFKGIEFERIQLEDVVSKFDLTFYFEKCNDALQIEIEYNTDIFNRTRIERMMDHLQALLEQLLKSPDTAVGKLDFIPSKERQLLLEAFNDTHREW